MTSAGELTLGVIVCCRDEERVIERRLRNLAVSKWPASARPHVVVVVDDACSDKTAAVAASTVEQFGTAPATFELIANRFRSGKSGAIESALAQLDQRVDVIVLTDADVVNDPYALIALAQAFRGDPRLGMASGSQTFVRGLLWSGPVEGASIRDSGRFYDHATAWVRAWESKGGRLFSVHGQLLAWRAELKLSTKLGLAADDLDLMRQVRRRGLRVERVPDARFFELRPFTEDLRHVQALRRARAYVQFAKTMTTDDVGDFVSRWQWRFYKHVPIVAPRFTMSLLVLVAIGGLIGLWIQARAGLVAPFAWIVTWLFAMRWVARQAWRFLGVIEEARQLERTQSMDDRWSTAR